MCRKPVSTPQTILAPAISFVAWVVYMAAAAFALYTEHRGARPVAADFLAQLRAWLERSGPVADDEVRSAIAGWVSEYTPYEAKPALRVVAGTALEGDRAASGGA